MTFTPAEAAYLTSQPLARFSTVSPDGQPDVVPVAFELDGTRLWIGGAGESAASLRAVGGSHW
jgi:pyridoxamine 5'-phosphate oxidase family protein